MTHENDLIRRGDVIAILSAASRTAQKTIDAIAALPAAQVTEVQALVEAVDHLLNNYLLDEHVEPELCVDDDHWSAIHDVFVALAAWKETTK